MQHFGSGLTGDGNRLDIVCCRDRQAASQRLADVKSGAVQMNGMNLGGWLVLEVHFPGWPPVASGGVWQRDWPCASAADTRSADHIRQRRASSAPAISAVRRSS